METTTLARLTQYLRDKGVPHNEIEKINNFYAGPDTKDDLISVVLDALIDAEQTNRKERV